MYPYLAITLLWHANVLKLLWAARRTVRNATMGWCEKTVLLQRSDLPGTSCSSPVSRTWGTTQASEWPVWRKIGWNLLILCMRTQSMIACCLEDFLFFFWNSPRTHLQGYTRDFWLVGIQFQVMSWYIRVSQGVKKRRSCTAVVFKKKRSGYYLSQKAQ